MNIKIDKLLKGRKDFKNSLTEHVVYYELSKHCLAFCVVLVLRRWLTIMHVQLDELCFDFWMFDRFYNDTWYSFISYRIVSCFVAAADLSLRQHDTNRHY